MKHKIHLCYVLEDGEDQFEIGAAVIFEKKVELRQDNNESYKDHSIIHVMAIKDSFDNQDNIYLNRVMDIMFFKRKFFNYHLFVATNISKFQYLNEHHLVSFLENCGTEPTKQCYNMFEKMSSQIQR